MFKVGLFFGSTYPMVRQLQLNTYSLGRRVLICIDKLFVSFPGLS